MFSRPAFRASVVLLGFHGRSSMVTGVADTWGAKLGTLNWSFIRRLIPAAHFSSSRKVACNTTLCILNAKTIPSPISKLVKKVKKDLVTDLVTPCYD